MMKLIIYFRVYDMNGKCIGSFCLWTNAAKTHSLHFKRENFNDSSSWRHQLIDTICNNDIIIL